MAGSAPEPDSDDVQAWCPVTPAAEIREAARRIRERAEAQEIRVWSSTGVGEHGYPQRVTPAAEHIAGMDPAIALLFADLLDDEAGVYEVYAESHNADIAERVVYRALIAARAVLGTETTDA